jgi:hypothetical protein
MKTEHLGSDFDDFLKDEKQDKVMKGCNDAQGKTDNHAC